MIQDIAFQSLSWHYWIAFAVMYLFTLMIWSNISYHYSKRWMYLFIPPLFTILIYFVCGFIFPILGW